MPEIALYSPRIQRQIGDVFLDVVLEEVERRSVSISDHPIEVPAGGSSPRGFATDHILLEPKTFVMRGAVSDHPITWRGRLGYPDSSSSPRSISTYELLTRLFESREPFTLQTRLAEHKNLVIETLTIPQSKETAHALFFTAELREIQTVSPSVARRQLTAEDMRGEQAQTQMVPENNLGHVEPKEVSIGARALDFLTGKGTP